MSLHNNRSICGLWWGRKDTTHCNTQSARHREISPLLVRSIWALFSSEDGSLSLLATMRSAIRSAQHFVHRKGLVSWAPVPTFSRGVCSILETGRVRLREVRCPPPTPISTGQRQSRGLGFRMSIAGTHVHPSSQRFPRAPKIKVFNYSNHLPRPVWPIYFHPPLFYRGFHLPFLSENKKIK